MTDTYLSYEGLQRLGLASMPPRRRAVIGALTRMNPALPSLLFSIYAVLISFAGVIPLVASAVAAIEAEAGWVLLLPVPVFVALLVAAHRAPRIAARAGDRVQHAALVAEARSEVEAEAGTSDD